MTTTNVMTEHFVKGNLAVGTMEQKQGALRTNPLCALKRNVLEVQIIVALEIPMIVTKVLVARDYAVFIPRCKY